MSRFVISAGRTVFHRPHMDLGAYTVGSGITPTPASRTQDTFSTASQDLFF